MILFYLSYHCIPLCNKWQKSLFTASLNPPIRINKKYPKHLSKWIREHAYKTMDISTIYSPISPPSLEFGEISLLHKFSLLQIIIPINFTRIIKNSYIFLVAKLLHNSVYFSVCPSGKYKCLSCYLFQTYEFFVNIFFVY